jgi:hypothetical protein
MKRASAVLLLLSVAAACRKSSIDASSSDDWPTRAAAKYRSSAKTRLLRTGVVVGDFGQRDACTLDDAGSLTCINPTPAMTADGSAPAPAPDKPHTVQISGDVARRTLNRAEASGLSPACHATLRDAEKRSGTGPEVSEFPYQELCRGDPGKDSTAACIKTCIQDLPKEVVALLAR